MVLLYCDAEAIEVISVFLIKLWCWVLDREVRGIRQCAICGKERRKSKMTLTAGHTWACTEAHAKLFEDSIATTRRGSHGDSRASWN
jgi:hypothetical protein